MHSDVEVKMMHDCHARSWSKDDAGCMHDHGVKMIQDACTIMDLDGGVNVMVYCGREGMQTVIVIQLHETVSQVDIECGILMRTLPDAECPLYTNNLIMNVDLIAHPTYSIKTALVSEL